jgi:hypothetical protein
MSRTARAPSAPAGGSVPGPASQPRGSALAPALAACAKIAMGVTMGYMLLVML